MSVLSNRRDRSIASFVLLCLISAGLYALFEMSLRPTSRGSGWLLLALMVALAVFNVRKKLPFLPLGSAASWLRFHVYAGFFAIFVFLVHMGFRVPIGALERILAALFAAVSISGIGGILLSRTLPLRLATQGETFLYERIPRLRLTLRLEVEERVGQAVREVESPMIPEFYSSRLADFFRRPRNLAYHLVESRRPYQMLERELLALERFADEREREILGEIHERMQLKNDLDYQQAQQQALRGWLFVHVPLTYSLVIVAGFHVALANNFGV